MAKNMFKKTKIIIAAFAVLSMTVLMVSLVTAALPTAKSQVPQVASVTSSNSSSSNLATPTPSSNTQSSSATSSPAPTEPSAIEKFKAQVPKTLEEAQAAIPIKTRYISYTSDGAHVVWGFQGHGNFTGTDNNGKQLWGIYGQGICAGFYDGKFFWGQYSNDGSWKAQYLFGLNNSSGKYVVFPLAIAATTATAP